MKKLLTIASGLVASSAMAFDMPAIKVDGKIEYNTKWVSEGVVNADHSFMPSVEVGLPLFGKANVYVGMDAYLAQNGEKAEGNRVDPYVGFSYDITDMFTLDVGYRAKISTFKKDSRLLAYSVQANGAIYPADENENKSAQATRHYQKKTFHEIYVGVMTDILLKPSLYFNYDITQQKFNLEGAVAYTFDFGNVGANGLAIDLGAKVGYTHTKKPLGLKADKGVKYEFLDARGHLDANNVGTVEDWFGKKGYVYAQLNADIVYKLNENSKIRAGVGVAFNNAKLGGNKLTQAPGEDKKDFEKRSAHLLNSRTGKKHAVWFSTAAEFSF